MIKATAAPEVAWFSSPLLKTCAVAQAGRPVELRAQARQGKTPPATGEAVEEAVGDSSAAVMAAAANMAAAAVAAPMEAEMAVMADLAVAAVQERQVHSVAREAAVGDSAEEAETPRAEP
jgi:hypothetical protein